MQLLNSLLAFATLLLPLVSAEACVAGGPKEQVSYAKQCCFQQSGTWYQFYDVQAICTFADNLQKDYRRCISFIPYSQLDTTCIPGDGGLNLAKPGETATLTTSAARETFTPSVVASTASAFVS